MAAVKEATRRYIAGIAPKDLEDLILSCYLSQDFQEGVRAFPAAAIEAYCRCSRERVSAFLKSFGAAELTDMREPDGSISVTCEFCTKTYKFAPDELG